MMCFQSIHRVSSFSDFFYGKYHLCSGDFMQFAKKVSTTYIRSSWVPHFKKDDQCFLTMFSMSIKLLLVGSHVDV